MARPFFYSLIFCFLIFPIFVIYPDSNLPRLPKKLIQTVIIDPGHGGTFPGAQGLFSLEKNVSLDVALKFGKALQEEFPDYENCVYENY